MEISIADQIALDDALVAPADRLKIGKCNLRLSSDVTSKEATLQVVYDVLKLTPFYKAFQVTTDAPEIYMQEFWASAYVHNRSKFEEPPLEKEILAFLASLGHSGEIKTLRLSQAQILWGMYNKNKVDYAYLLWEDFTYQKVIKEQVKKEVSKITPKIEKLVNEQLESEVLVRSSKEAKTSHAVAANLSELELKKILIDKMEANNSINRSDIQRQLYKALV
ncbi:hypothetical protein Tco_1565847, partial [Tanacetum coccineum]